MWRVKILLFSYSGSILGVWSRLSVCFVCSRRATTAAESFCNHRRLPRLSPFSLEANYRDRDAVVLGFHLCSPHGLLSLSVCSSLCVGAVHVV